MEIIAVPPSPQMMKYEKPSLDFCSCTPPSSQGVLLKIFKHSNKIWERSRFFTHTTLFVVAAFWITNKAKASRAPHFIPNISLVTQVLYWELKRSKKYKNGLGPLWKMWKIRNQKMKFLANTKAEIFVQNHSFPYLKRKSCNQHEPIFVNPELERNLLSTFTHFIWYTLWITISTCDVVTQLGQKKFVTCKYFARQFPFFQRLNLLKLD